MSEKEPELHVRGHRVAAWRANVLDLRARRISPSAFQIGLNSDGYDFASEEASDHHDYSGGTMSGMLSYSEKKRKHIASILNADPQTLVRVDGDLDDNCHGCASKERRHCHFPMREDATKTLELVRLAKELGYEVTPTYHPHPLDASRQSVTAMIPAGVIHHYVFQE